MDGNQTRNFCSAVTAVFCAANTFWVASALHKYGKEWKDEKLIPIQFNVYGNVGAYGHKYMLWMYPAITFACFVSEMWMKKKHKMNEENKSNELLKWEKDYISWTTVLTSTLMLYLTGKSIQIATKKQKPTIGGKAISIILVIAGIYIYYGLQTKPSKH